MKTHITLMTNNARCSVSERETVINLGKLETPTYCRAVELKDNETGMQRTRMSFTITDLSQSFAATDEDAETYVMPSDA